MKVWDVAVSFAVLELMDFSKGRRRAINAASQPGSLMGTNVLMKVDDRVNRSLGGCGIGIAEEQMP